MENSLIILKNFFTPDSIIHLSYWNSYDKVISFNTNPSELGYTDWSVRVIACDKQGNPLPNAEERVHCTHPDRKDRIIYSPLFKSSQSQ